MGTFHIYKIENGYILEATGALHTGVAKLYFCEGLKDVGDRITALCVEKELKAA